ncbi:hypothetical protein IC218_06845 [Clostridioides sp. ES-S-0005-03]|uniref:immunoglobulin-like domain-containing protein n=1 Tax=Clostridioides sp. ES-S-0005-03 TaxID=2770774 RepID=UPI001D12B9A9|nr:hypothetical protein [Clostridioides sp. ES-S-0005-03]UDN46217.1 hypothetical protein JJJ25_11690 [Clostridioides sp. ES-S-0173-01]
MLGIINRPDFYEGDKEVYLSATVKSGEVSKTKKFKVLVKASKRTDLQSVLEDIGNLSIPNIVTENLTFIQKGSCGSTIVWSSSSPNIIGQLGKVTRPVFGEQDAKVTINIIVSKGSVSRSKEFKVTVPAWTQEGEVESAANAITWELIRNKNTDINKVTGDLVLPTTIGNEISITWTTSNSTCLSDKGVVTRPAYKDGDSIVSVTATLTKGELISTKTITNIRILKQEPTNQEKVDDFVKTFDFVSYIAPNKSLTELSDNFTLPAKVENMSLTFSALDNEGEDLTSTNIKLELDNQALSYKATIVRPSSNIGDFSFNLKIEAKITVLSEGETSEEIKASKIYPAKILAMIEE